MRVSGQSVPYFSGCVLAGLLAIASTSAHAEQVVCHYTYGGETKRLVAEPVSSPHAKVVIGPRGALDALVDPLDLALQRAPLAGDVPATVAIVADATADEGPVLIHQAIYPYPPTRSSDSRYGFSGLHFVYEPVRDGELQYWCAMTNPESSAPAGRPAASTVR